VRRYGELVDRLKTEERILITGHENPDADSVGSCVAMQWLIDRLRGNRGSLIFIGDDCPDNLRFLLVESRFTDDLGDEFASCAIVLDSEPHRTGGARRSIEKADFVVNIDHHQTNPGRGDMNLIVPGAAATAEVVFDLIQECFIDGDRYVATSLYAGLAGDTGSFRYGNTTARTLEIARRLVDWGADPAEISTHVFETKPLAYLRVLGELLAGIETSDDGKIVWMVLREDTLERWALRETDIDGFSTFPRMVEGCEVAIFFREVSRNEVRVSFRARNQVDVGAIAVALGGGGHRAAAGCTLDIPLSNAIQRVLSTVRNRLMWCDYGCSGC